MIYGLEVTGDENNELLQCLKEIKLLDHIKIENGFEKESLIAENIDKLIEKEIKDFIENNKTFGDLNKKNLIFNDNFVNQNINSNNTNNNSGNNLKEKKPSLGNLCY
jgi:hypothetical protein